jgi:hypothetical protein
MSSESHYDSVTADFSRSHLEVRDHGGFQSRNESVIELLKAGYARARDRLPDVVTRISVHTADRPEDCRTYAGRQPFFISGTREAAERCFPCFSFQHWREVGIPDYEEVTAAIRSAGQRAPLHRRVFWAGHLACHASRRRMVEVAAAVPTLCEFVGMEWNFGVPNAYKSMPDQAMEYAALCDVEGLGYSGRLKFLAHSGRPLLVLDRETWDWAGAQLVAGEHYAPVARDSSDLLDVARRVLRDTEEASAMGRRCASFAAEHLTRAAAVRHVEGLLLENAIREESKREESRCCVREWSDWSPDI